MSPCPEPNESSLSAAALSEKIRKAPWCLHRAGSLERWDSLLGRKVIPLSGMMFGRILHIFDVYLRREPIAFTTVNGSTMEERIATTKLRFARYPYSYKSIPDDSSGTIQYPYSSNPLDCFKILEPDWECQNCLSIGMRFDGVCAFCGMRTGFVYTLQARQCVTAARQEAAGTMFVWPGTHEWTPHEITFMRHSPDYMLQWAL